MRAISRLILVVSAFILAGCLETIPKMPSIDDLPASPTLKDRNAAIAQAWDKASLECRSQYKPRGSFCEQLKTEGEFLSCSAERFAKSAQALRYPAPDKIWVWHNCVKTTANLLRDGAYLTKPEIEKRMSACQARFDPEPEFPVRQSGWFAPLVALISTDDKETVRPCYRAILGSISRRWHFQVALHALRPSLRRSPSQNRSLWLPRFNRFFQPLPRHKLSHPMQPSRANKAPSRGLEMPCLPVRLSRHRGVMLQSQDQT